jgi:osmotically inducible lipoprotein OsmB
MMKLFFGAILVMTLALGGCAGMTPTEQRTLSGGAMGAGAGAVFGAIAGNAALGAAIGGAVGTAGGFLYDQHKQAEEAAYRQGYQNGRRDY